MGFFPDDVYPTINTYDSSEGTLKLIHVDWKNGEIDFSFVTPSLNPLHRITFKISIRTGILDVETKDTKFRYLRSFQAFAMFITPSGDFRTIEKRIPPYTYTLNVPVTMFGLRSEDDKKWDDLLSSLSQQDQEAWENYQAEGFVYKCRFFDDLFEERNTHRKDQIRETIFPGWKKRKAELQKGGRLTADEKSRLKEYVLGHLSKCLARSNISSEGQQKILEPMYARYGFGGITRWAFIGTNKDDEEAMQK